MQAFRSAFRIIAARPIYLLVYIVWLTIMGLFIGGALNLGSGDEYEPVREHFAIIDRDGSAVVSGLAEFLSDGSDQVQITDDSFAMQDAVATGNIECLIVVPADFSEQFIAAARDGEGAAVPLLDLTYSYNSVSGTLVQTQVDQYLTLVRASAILDPEATVDEVVARSVATAPVQADVQTVVPDDGADVMNRMVFYLQWCAYTMTAGIVVCAGLLMSAFGRRPIDRRNAVSPVSPVTLGIAKFAASGVLTLGVVVFVIGAGCIAFSSSLEGISGQAFGLMVCSVVAFALVPLSISFLLGQLGVGEMAANAIGNIAGIVLTFLGGAWMPLEFMPETVQTLARFTPVWWYTQALNQSVSVGSASVANTLSSIGVILLFGVAIFFVALLIRRRRA